MKPIIPFIIFFLSVANVCMAQEIQTFTFNGFRESEEIKKLTYQFPDFIKGKIFFENNTTAEARMNYSRLDDQLLFIDTMGDTVALGNPKTAAMIIIGSDTLYYSNLGYVQKITHYTFYNLANKQTLDFVGVERKTGYGGYSSTAATKSVNGQNPMSIRLGVDESQIYKVITNYFISDTSGFYFAAIDKNFYTIFSQYKKQLKGFAQANKINFRKRVDLEKFLQYAHTLN